MSLAQFFKLVEKLSPNSLSELNHIGRRASIAAIFKIVPKSQDHNLWKLPKKVEIRNKEDLNEHFNSQS